MFFEGGGANFLVNFFFKVKHVFKANKRLPENFLKIRLDLAKIYSMLKRLDWCDKGEKEERRSLTTLEWFNTIEILMLTIKMPNLNSFSAECGKHAQYCNLYFS